MPVIAIAPLDRRLAGELAAVWGVPAAYDEVVAALAGRLGLGAARVARLLDGSAGWLERLAVDRTAASLCSAAEVVERAARGADAVVPAYSGAFRWLRAVPGVLCIARRDLLPGSGRQAPEVALELRVRAALRLAPPTRALHIAVSAEGGRVSLEGVVPTGTQCALADAVAAGVAGVRRLDNRLRPIDRLRPRFA